MPERLECEVLQKERYIKYTYLYLYLIRRIVTFFDFAPYKYSCFLTDDFVCGAMQNQ